jgi:hypothetical protein
VTGEREQRRRENAWVVSEIQKRPTRAFPNTPLFHAHETRQRSRSRSRFRSENRQIDVPPRIPPDVTQQRLHLEVGLDEVDVQRGIAQVAMELT